MPKVTILHGEKEKIIEVPSGTLMGTAITTSALTFEQPCAGRGTCGKCKVLEESGLTEPDEVEKRHLSHGELAIGTRLACRARIQGDARIILPPVNLATDKAFKLSNRYRIETGVPLGLAIDLGSTVTAAFLTMLDDGEVCAAAATLNQQVIFGADVISRMAATLNDPANRERLHRLAVSSINQAIQNLHLSKTEQHRITCVVIVSNPAMHHLLIGLPVERLAMLPFEPHTCEPVYDANPLLGGIFPESVQVRIPPLIGGFVGADALACLAYFRFDEAAEPMLAVDLGTNGEVMLTDGIRILTTSTAAGPAFEGANISCGSRAVDGAITRVWLDENKQMGYESIGKGFPSGITGSGLLSAVHTFRGAGAIESNGRIDKASHFVKFISSNPEKSRVTLPITADGGVWLCQNDIRELQKAKGAIRSAVDILLEALNLEPKQLKRVILTGSFGGRIEIDAALELGLLPSVDRALIENIPNGAGMGAAEMLSDEGFERAVRIAHKAEHINLNQDNRFLDRFAGDLRLCP